MKSLKDFERRLVTLSIGSHETISDDSKAFLDSLTWAEEDQMTEIFIKHALAGDQPYENLTSEEADFLITLLERPVKPVPPNVRIKEAIDRERAIDECFANMPRDSGGNRIACGGGQDV